MQFNYMERLILYIEDGSEKTVLKAIEKKIDIVNVLWIEDSILDQKFKDP